MAGLGQDQDVGGGTNISDSVTLTIKFSGPCPCWHQAPGAAGHGSHKTNTECGGQGLGRGPATRHPALIIVVIIIPS